MQHVTRKVHPPPRRRTQARAISICGAGPTARRHPTNLFASTPTRPKPADLPTADKADPTSCIEAALLEDREARSPVLCRVRTDLEMLRRYRHVPGPVLDCDMVTVRSTEDSPLTARQAAARGDLTTGSLHSAALPGGHFHLAPRLPMATFLEPWPTGPHHVKSWRDDALGT